MTSLRHILPVALAAAIVSGAAMAWSGNPGAAADLRLAVFPPIWGDVRIFRAIVLGGARPISSTLIPGAWLVHLDPGQPSHLPGALLVDAGPFIRLAPGACLTPPERR